MFWCLLRGISALCCLNELSKVCITKWPPFVKELLTSLTDCSFCNSSYMLFISHLGLWVGEALFAMQIHGEIVYHKTIIKLPFLGAEQTINVFKINKNFLFLWKQLLSNTPNKNQMITLLSSG